jgi:uncharacterized protein YkwD
MPAHPRHTSRRRVIVAVIAIAVLALGAFQAPTVSAGEGYRERMLELINASRDQHGLRPLRINLSLSQDATRHSRKMLRQNRVFDPPNLEEILSRYPYDDVGAAAVGCDATLRQLHRAFMRSEVHRSILLHPRLRRVGIGMLQAPGPNRCGRGSFWVTEIFYG